LVGGQKDESKLLFLVTVQTTFQVINEEIVTNKDQGDKEILSVDQRTVKLSELDESTVIKNVAEAEKIYIDSRVVEPEEVAVSRFGGDGTNLTDMIIDVDRRNTFLDELSKTPIDLNEGGDDETDGDDPEDKVEIKEQ